MVAHNVATCRSNFATWRSTLLCHDVLKGVTFFSILLHHGEHFLCHDVHFLRHDVFECRTQQLMFSFDSSINLLDFHSRTINFMLSVMSRCGEATSRR